MRLVPTRHDLGRSSSVHVSIVATLLLAAVVTYRTGGTVYVFPHLFYVPVVIAASFFGARGGLIIGLLAGVTCGPFMPKDVVQGIPQTLDGWLLRMAFFVGIGVLVGVLSSQLNQRIKALRTLNDQTILAFVRAIDAKDQHTARHSEKVAQFAELIARRMGLAERDVQRIRHAALLHDVGKIAVPGNILNKPAKLTDDEYDLIRQHPLDSVRIINGIDQYKDYIPGVRYHHERVDGLGYPDGISGSDIPIDARIIAVADAFEAMTSDRAYRPKLGVQEALRRLKAGAGTQFDAQVVDCLCQIVSDDDSLTPVRSSRNSKLQSELSS